MQTMERPRPPVSVRLDAAEEAAARRLAAMSDLTLSQLLRRGLRAVLAEQSAGGLTISEPTP